MLDPTTATVVAGVLGICSALENLIWDVPLLSQICWNATDGTNFDVFVPTHLGQIQNLFEVFGAGLFCLVMSIFGIIFGLLSLDVKSGRNNHWLHCFWIHSSLRSLSEFLLGYYFFLRSYQVLTLASPDEKEIPTSSARREADTYYSLAIFFSGIYFFWPLVNFIFSMMVMKKAMEVDEDQEKASDKPKNEGERTPLTEKRPPADYIPYSKYHSIQITELEREEKNKKNKDKDKNFRNIIDSISNNIVVDPRDYEHLL